MTCSCRAGIASGIVLLAMLAHGNIAALFVPKAAKHSMDHFAGLDISVKDASACIVDDTGRMVREVKVASEPEAVQAVLKNLAYRLKQIGLEAGPLSQWIDRRRRYLQASLENDGAE